MDENTLNCNGANNAETIAHLTALSLSARTVSQPKLDCDSVPHLVISTDQKVADIERLLPQPYRKREYATLHTVDSFCAYVNRHMRAGRAVVFVSEPASTFVAVLNYHPNDNEGAPDWCDHRATYAMPQSTEWATWLNSSGKYKNQTDFAQFIEDNLPDIVDPSGAKLLDMVKTLQAKRAVSFESAVRLDNGDVEFMYTEDTKGTVGKGKLDIPTEFTIGIPPYRGEAPFKLTARLRYRINDTKLVLWYDLVRPHKVVEQVMAEVRERIAKATEVPMFDGVL